MEESAEQHEAAVLLLLWTWDGRPAHLYGSRGIDTITFASSGSEELLACCRLPNDPPELAGDAVPPDQGGGEAQSGQDRLKR